MPASDSADPPDQPVNPYGALFPSLFPSMAGAAALAGHWTAYLTDSWQRSILTLDVLRERGNMYAEHEQSGKPPVLVFDYEVIVDARQLPRPANYALARIKPDPAGVATDPLKRPFVVIDPRAGHGPGIGGSKIDSEIGIALKQGHPCYFVMFYPQPVPGQTIECVTEAERVFLHKVNELHPDAAGKPFVIGNCQGGWALMMLAALAPDSVGPLLLAGSPLSYWSGEAGKYPMRYSGGLLGGTWAASFAGDLGNGKFDGAYLVNNFEKLDPANTHLHKPYSLYSKVDTERQRFLDFERWWGGHFLLNKEEMEWISQNLFVGNRLTSGELSVDDGRQRIDLRNIRSPVIVFASWGDNITPPQQALNWIPDLYADTDEIRDNEQTIVYFLHEHVGHLGIFVSAGVANREHSELASALDLIDVLPPGLYQAVITDTYPDMPGLEFATGRYVTRFEPREVSDILALDKDGRQDEAAFEVVKRVAQVNQSLYDTFVSPWVRALSSEASAAAWRNLNPARLERSLISDNNPWIKALQPLAAAVRAQRKPVSSDNPLLHIERQASEQMALALNQFRDARDAAGERLFKGIYESPWMAAWTGIKPVHSAGEGRAAVKAPRARSQQQQELHQLKQAERETWYRRGSPEAGFLRLLIYVASGVGVVDKRPFEGIRQLMRERGLDKTVSLAQLKEAVKLQTYLVRLDEERALEGLTMLLPQPAQRSGALELARQLLARGGPIKEEKLQRLRKVAQILQVEQSGREGGGA